MKNNRLSPSVNLDLLTIALTTIALIAFAANSLLTRLALGGSTIDPASFVTIRLASGAIMLWLITTCLGSQPTGSIKVNQRNSRWVAPFMLFLYAVTFSFAYLQLTAGMGALILFGTVQVTMLLAALKQGEKPHLFEWAGLCMALAGLVYLVSPGLEAPPFLGSGLMVISGIAWGFYSLLGRGVGEPVSYTATNFMRAVPFALGMSLVGWARMMATWSDVLLAVLSGAIASGIGYAIWYAALKGLTATRAATVQLAVPVLAAAGGIVFLQETLSLRFAIASVAILCGIGLSIARRKPLATAVAGADHQR